MKIEVNVDLCLGHGQCELVAPTLFEVDDSGRAVVLRQPRDAEVAAASAAVDSCPERAITLED